VDCAGTNVVFTMKFNARKICTHNALIDVINTLAAN